MKTWTALLVALLPTNVLADGPALAHLTLDGTTTALTADPDVSAPDMIRRDADTLHLHFAQLHLGFPIAPFLTLSLHDTEDGWVISEITLERTSFHPPVVLSTDALRVVETSGTDENLRFSIEGEVLTPAQAPQPIHLDIVLSSP